MENKIKNSKFRDERAARSRWMAKAWEVWERERWARKGWPYEEGAIVVTFICDSGCGYECHDSQV